MKPLLNRILAAAIVAIIFLLPVTVPVQAQSSLIPLPVLGMLAKLDQITSAKGSFIMSANIFNSDVNESVTVSLMVTGISNDEDRAELDFIIMAVSDGKSFIEEVGTDRLIASGTFRMTSEEHAYVYFSDLPEIRDMDLEDFEGKWIDLSSEFAYEAEGTTEEDIEIFLRAYVEYPVVDFVEQGSTMTDYRYQLEVNEENIAGFLNEMAPDGFSESDLFVEEDFKLFFTMITDASAHLIISKATLLPKELFATVSVEDDTEGSDMAVTALFKATYESFNQPFTVSKPKDALTIDELLQLMYGFEDADF